MIGKLKLLVPGGVWLAILLTLGCGRRKVLEPLVDLQKIGSCSTLGYAQDVVLVDSLAYLATGQGGLEIIDVSDPENPFTVGSFDIPMGLYNYATSLEVKTEKAYIGYGYDGLLIVDVSNPAQPAYLGQVAELRVEDLAISSTGEFTYVCTAARHQFAIVDATDPEYPWRVVYISTPGKARGIFVLDTLAYVADEQLGLQIINFSDVFSPTIEGSCDTESNARDVWVEGDYAYIADGRGGLQIVETTDIDSLSIVGSCNTPGYAKKIVIHGNYAFVADGSEGLQVIDVTDPTSPYIVGNYPTPYTHGVFVTEDYVFLADRDRGLIILTYPD